MAGCTDCNEVGYFLNDSDGKCAKCEGTGKISTFVSRLSAGVFGGEEDEDDCDDCDGTGDCQTCDGTGEDQHVS